jgi:hypothetical protein
MVYQNQKNVPSESQETNYLVGALILVVILFMFITSNCYQNWMYERNLHKTQLLVLQKRSMQMLTNDLEQMESENFEATNDDPKVNNHNRNNVKKSTVVLHPDLTNKTNRHSTKTKGPPFDPRDAASKVIIERDESSDAVRETLVLIPNRYRTFQEQSDYWLSRMDNSEFSVDDLPKPTK